MRERARSASESVGRRGRIAHAAVWGLAALLRLLTDVFWCGTSHTGGRSGPGRQKQFRDGLETSVYTDDSIDWKRHSDAQGRETEIVVDSRLGCVVRWERRFLFPWIRFAFRVQYSLLYR